MPPFARLSIHLAYVAVAFVVLLPTARAASPLEKRLGERIVYLARELPDEKLIVLGSALAAWNPDSAFLLDSHQAAPYLQAFLTDYKPTRIVPIGETTDKLEDLERHLEIKTSSRVAWPQAHPLALWKSLFRCAEDVVVCPAQPRATLLQAACLAAALRAPLFVTHGQSHELPLLTKMLGQWRTRRVHLVGKAEKLAPQLAQVEGTLLAGESAVALAYQKTLLLKGRIENVLFVNPSDNREGWGGTSALAPWLAVQRRAALLLTNAEGNNVVEVMDRAQRREALRHVDAILYLANLKAIPVWHRPNPIPGDKDQQIEMEPLTPEGNQPFTYAIGRLFHADRAVVPLILARQRLLLEKNGPLKALVASNSGSSLSLLETFSRNTIAELRNAGYETTALIGNKVSREEVRKQMPLHDLFLWEGHSGTLMNDYEFPTWTDPLPPTFVFLQSCLSLTEPRVGSLMNRGAVAVLGSSTRTYSGSGGACSLAFFNALLYGEQPVGDALRQAKNFLLVYSQLKEKRLGDAAKRTGANVRSAWAFSLWGDPTLKLPAPARTSPELENVRFIRHEVHGNTITISVPDKTNEVRTDKYRVELPPNGRFAGLVRKQKIDERRPLVPFVFAEVYLPHARPGSTPHLTSPLSSHRWVFCWDERRRRGYLLITPRHSDAHEIRFHVSWETEQAKMKAKPSKDGEE